MLCTDFVSQLTPYVVSEPRLQPSGLPHRDPQHGGTAVVSQRSAAGARAAPDPQTCPWKRSAKGRHVLMWDAPSTHLIPEMATVTPGVQEHLPRSHLGGYLAFCAHITPTERSPCWSPLRTGAGLCPAGRCVQAAVCPHFSLLPLLATDSRVSRLQHSTFQNPYCTALQLKNQDNVQLSSR